nr:hypothetical protein BCU10_06950 [Vibrio splendidus]
MLVSKGLNNLLHIVVNEYRTQQLHVVAHNMGGLVVIDSLSANQFRGYNETHLSILNNGNQLKNSSNKVSLFTCFLNGRSKPRS